MERADKLNEIFKLWDSNADRDKATGADLKYQMKEDMPLITGILTN